VTSRPPTDKTKAPPAKPRADLARNILLASCTMIGMCATLVGLVKFVDPNKSFDTVLDECAAVIGIIFLCSAVLSYLAIRTADRPRVSRYVERGADVLFVVGLVGIAAAILFLAFEII
jgi:hypothetical protein